MHSDQQNNCAVVKQEDGVDSLFSDVRKYKMFMDVVNDGVFDFDFHRNTIEFNDKWFEMLGYDPLELPHDFDSWKSLVHKHDVNNFERGFNQLTSKCQAWDHEYRMRAKNSCWIWVHIHARPVECNDEGIPQRVIGTHTNIYRRKLVEETIASQLYLSHLSQVCSVDDLLRAFLDEAEKLTNSNIGFFHFLEKDQKTISLQVWSTNTSETMCKTTGHKMHYDLDEAGVWVDCVRERKTILHNDYDSLPHKKGLPEGHAPVLRELVVPVFREGNIVAFFGLGNKPVFYTEDDIKTAETLADMAWDIVDRKMVEQELKEHHQHLEDLVDKRTEELNTKNIDLENAMNRLHDTQSQLIVYEKMEALRHLISGIAHEINTPLGAIGASNRVIHANFIEMLRKLSTLTEWLDGPDGCFTHRVIEQANSIKGDSRYMSSVEKREKRKEIEKILSDNGIGQCRELAHTMVEMYIVDDVVHLLPMLENENIMERLNMLRYVLDIFQSCETIEAAVKKSSTTINALNKYMRKSCGDNCADEKMKIVDIKGNLESVLPLFHNSTKRLESFDVSFEKEELYVMAYPDELIQVWTNLLQNSLFAMQGKGNLKIKTSCVDGYAVIEVIDDGCGMTEEVKNRMFEPLFTTKPEGKGIGLGMDIVQKIVKEDHNGCIEVESEPGKGTTISIWLPTASFSANNEMKL